MNYPLNILDLTHTIASDYLQSFEYVWLALKDLKGYIAELGETLGGDYIRIYPTVWIHKSADISPTAFIGEYCIIGANTQVRHGAFIRGIALIGDNCVIGNSTEVKNSIIFDGVQVPHFNYVGDSILGYKAHLGAGTITSNVKSDKSNVHVTVDGKEVNTGLKKLGSVIGNFVEIGCNCVLNPGTFIGAYTRIYPLNSVRGSIPESSIYKSPQQIIKII